jgi:alkylation response protein AidB-like acyl-CoA dehydrogenase
MNFDWSKEEERLYQDSLAMAREILPDLTTPSQWRDRWRQLGRAGFLGLCIPRKLGGAGHGALATALAIEALGRGSADMGIVFSAAAHLFACAMPIAEHGCEVLQARLFPGLASGDLVGANAITESEAGSDVTALRCRAIAEGDGYRLAGSKSFVTNGPVADVTTVYATRNPTDGFLGITAFAVERGTPGLSVGRPIEKVSLATAPASWIELSNCLVSSSARLGAEGQGASVFQRSMTWERSCLFAAYVGMLDRQLDRTIAFARERKQFGRSIGRNQAVSHRIAEMKLRLERSRLLLYRACWRIDQGKPADLDIALSKLSISHSAVASSTDAVHLHGGAGIESQNGIERMLRDALPSTIFSGTSEIQRELIARELGL